RSIREAKFFLSLCVGNPQQQLQEKGVIDDRCSRHITRNMSYLSEYEEIDGGYVAFGGDPKEEKSLVKIRSYTESLTSSCCEEDL
nr:hypothetical protein [Tanacetum cinerariifolium]